MDLKRTMLAPVLALGLLVGAAPAARAATELPFSQGAFDAARRDGRPILAHITAPWCPYCAKQRPILSALEQDPSFEKLVVHDVDFDTQKDAARALGAQKQSTLIAFHGASEKGRSTGATDAAAIRALLDKTND